MYHISLVRIGEASYNLTSPQKILCSPFGVTAVKNIIWIIIWMYEINNIFNNN